jgi:hypothetical protein
MIIVLGAIKFAAGARASAWVIGAPVNDIEQIRWIGQRRL